VDRPACHVRLGERNEALKKEFDDAGVVYVTNYTTGPIQLICTKPVKSLEDIKGLKIRASGPYGDTLADLGAEVNRMSQADVYQALDSGLIDCNQNYYYSMKGYKQYEVAPYVLEMDWGQNMSFGIVMNKASYQSLSDDEKKLLAEVASDFEDYQAKLMMEEQEQVKAQMQAGIDGKKIEVTVLSPEEKQRLLEMSDKYIQQWVDEATKDGIDGAAVLADYRDRIAAYKQEQESTGYPWTR
jgi:TRAP-type C4-dicarboxylate transport system substrate-binding protein